MCLLKVIRHEARQRRIIEEVEGLWLDEDDAHILDCGCLCVGVIQFLEGAGKLAGVWK